VAQNNFVIPAVQQRLQSFTSKINQPQRTQRTQGKDNRIFVTSVLSVPSSIFVFFAFFVAVLEAVKD